MMKIAINLEDVNTIANVSEVIEEIRNDGGSMKPFEFEISKVLCDILATNKKIQTGTLFGVPFKVIDRIDKQRVRDILNRPMELCFRHIPNDALIKNTQYWERQKIKKELGL